MCGITVISGRNMSKNRYNTVAMLQMLGRRGPDEGNEVSFPHCWLGHRRLSIVDQKNGGQPMSFGKISVVFNGEIYNSQSLRVKLMKEEGCSFLTNSDTETILKAYSVWGKDCPKYLDGMFAFAIWDNDSQELFVARDRFGKKPLYYFFDGNTIVLASEIKSLLASMLPFHSGLSAKSGICTLTM